MLRLLILIALLFLVVPVWAQSDSAPVFPTTEQVLEQRDQARDLLNQAGALQHDQDLQSAITEGRQQIDMIQHKDGLRGFLDSIPGINDRTGQSEFVDRVLQAGEQDAQTVKGSNYNPMSPIVLVSFSMPEAALISHLEEAQQLGAAVYLRGFLDDNVNATIDRLIELSKESEYALAIDPTVFTRFNVESVPSYILPTEPIIPCDDSGCITPAHVRATGAAGLRYFLDLVKRTGNQVEKAAATSWLEKRDES